MLVACRDLGQVVAWSTTAGAALLRSERGRWVVGAGVDGVAVDAEHHEAWAWSPFDRRLDRLALDDGAIQPDDTITLVATRTVPAAEGRREFHTPRAFDGRSCASCHIDGRDDGLVWQSPRGVVQTPVLAGRLEDTAPFGWHGDGVDLADHMRRTFRRMRAAPPDDATLAALEAYLRVMPTYLPEPGRWTAAQARGREVFRSPAAGCDACHADDVGTDAARHAIVRGAPIDTPSLRFVGDTAPYMHDGRYATLRETLVHTDSRMGLTSGLSEGEIADLIAYLRVL
jgi:mono/diheme cytochrome c family protein